MANDHREIALRDQSLQLAVRVCYQRARRFFHPQSAGPEPLDHPCRRPMGSDHYPGGLHRRVDGRDALDAGLAQAAQDFRVVDQLAQNGEIRTVGRAKRHRHRIAHAKTHPQTVGHHDFHCSVAS